jgi:streptogramin lyase
MKYLVLFLLNLLVICAYGQKNVKVILTDADKTLIPEGIAVHRKTGVIYVSSINSQKIVRIDKRGHHTDFIPSGKYGFLEGLGLKIDEASNWIWALSNKKQDGIYISRLQAFDLESGEEKVHHSISDTVQHLFNDLAIVGGNIYITDTYFSALYQLDISRNELKLLKKHTHLTYPNGITSDQKGEQLYIATYQNGIVRMDLKTGETYVLPGAGNGAVFKGLDGLVFYRNWLVGIYNIGEPAGQRVIQYNLANNGESITSEKEIDKGNRYFREPTTLALYKRFIYVIANSYLRVYNDNKESTTGIEEKLAAPVIIRYKLKK